MSYQTPIEFTITNPIFADLAAQKIQQAMIDASELDWLEFKFGRARIGREERKGVEISYPTTQQTFGTDFINCSPNDFVLSQSYILIQNDSPVSQAEGKNIVNWIADCSIIFFISDLNKIDTSYGANIEQLLRADIQQVLKVRVPNFTFTEWVDEIEDVYAEFTVDAMKPVDNTDHKKKAYFRANGTITYKTPCYTTFPYDGNFDFDPLDVFDFIYGGTFTTQP